MKKRIVSQMGTHDQSQDFIKNELEFVYPSDFSAGNKKHSKYFRKKGI